MLPRDDQSEAMQNRIKVANKCISFASMHGRSPCRLGLMHANSTTVINPRRKA